MKKTFLALIVWTVFAAGCRGPQARPDYDGSRSASERSHGSLDKEANEN